MTDYIAAYGNPQSPYHREANRLADKLMHELSETRLKDGILRWSSNNRVPPADVVAFAAHLDLPVDISKCDAAREVDIQDFLKVYREGQANLSAEARAEMRYERAANRY